VIFIVKKIKIAYTKIYQQICLLLYYAKRSGHPQRPSPRRRPGTRAQKKDARPGAFCPFHPDLPANPPRHHKRQTEHEYSPGSSHRTIPWL